MDALTRLERKQAHVYWAFLDKEKYTLADLQKQLVEGLIHPVEYSRSILRLWRDYLYEKGVIR